MTDIVERLRRIELWQYDQDCGDSWQSSLGTEAADEIERLRAALEQAVDDFGEGHCVCEQTKQECIRALEPKP